MTELSDEARALLGDLADVHEPAPHVKARVRREVAAKILAAGAVGAAATGAAAEASAATAAIPGLLGMTTAAKVGLSVALGGVALAGVLAVAALGTGDPVASGPERSAPTADDPPMTRSPRLAGEVEAAEAAPEVSAPVQPAAETSAAETSAPESTLRAEASPRALRTPSRRRPRETEPPPAAAPEHPAAREALDRTDFLLVADALSAWRAERPERALGILAEHRERFPDTRYRTEAEGIRVLSLCSLTRPGAVDAAARYLAQQGGHPYAALVRSTCR